MIAETDDGVYMDTNRSWSIDDRRLNFQFGCEVGYELKGGGSGVCCATPPTPVSALSSGGRWTGSGARPSGSFGARRTAARASLCRSATLATPRYRAGSATFASGYGDERPDPSALAERVVEMVGRRAEAAVYRHAHPSGPHPLRQLLHHQNVVDEHTEIYLQLSLDGRPATATTYRSDDQALEGLAGRALVAAALRPVDPAWAGLARRLRS